jgi:uncharacterized SAM-binding protein YcdF (DUF218 family)
VNRGAPRGALRELAGPALAVIGLEATWLVAAEAWREASPWKLAAFVVGPWALLALAWLVRLAPRPGGVLQILAALLAVNVAIDALHPYPARFAFVGWEALRAVALGAAALLARWRGGQLRGAPLRVASALRGASLATAVLVPCAMLYIAVTGSRDEASPADAALVLGFALDDAGQARPQLLGRMDRAADLQRQGIVPRLVLSGGAAKSGRTEAGVMRELAIARGVPPDALVLDEAARSTIENFACSLPILERLNARRTLVVTEPWHMRRAMLLARRHGLDARAAPATSEVWRSPRHAAYWLFRDANAFVLEAIRSAWATPGRCASAECEGCRRF